MEFHLGDVVRTKKPHPCGSYEWTILRMGIDFKMRCNLCQHEVMLPRVKFEKAVKKILQSNYIDSAKI